MKAAVVGCGMISETYLVSLRQFQVIEVAACCDLNEERAHRVAEKFHIEALSWEEILKKEEIELVINLTNPAAHYKITKQALEAGKHVYSEKMIAVEKEDGFDLCRTAKKCGLRLGVAPDTFLGAGIQTARYVLEHGLAGEVTSGLVSLNKDFYVMGDILPHLLKAGGGILFDSGCYYLTALVYLLGPVRKVTGFAAVNRPERENRRVGSIHYGEKIRVESENVVAGALAFECGALVSLHFSSESIMNENSRMELYGTNGILSLGDPNTFDGKVMLQKPLQLPVEFPFTHGYAGQSRGIGAAEMAWAIGQNRPHRASMEMALHVFEIAHGLLESAKSGTEYEMMTTFEKPAMLPEGYVDNGAWGPTQERALAEWK